jgi:hypothetical protein
LIAAAFLFFTDLPAKETRDHCADRERNCEPNAKAHHCAERNRARDAINHNEWLNR